MKNCFINLIISFLVCLLFEANIFSQANTKINPNGYNTFFHPNGKVASEGMYRDGKPDKYWKTYYLTGVLRSEGNRVNFLKDSTWVFYTATGDTSEIINYRSDKRSGFYLQYETITQRNNISRHYLKSKEIFLDDKREGSAYYYYPSGKIKQIIHYKNGKKQGKSQEFDENGTIITLYEYHNDKMTAREFINRKNEKGEKTGVWKTFYPNGEKKEEEFYKNGVLDGVTLVYSERGILLNERTFSGGNLIGEDVPMAAEPMLLITYHEDGVTIKRKGTYLDSIPIGFHYYYNTEGMPDKSIRYSERASGVATAEGPFMVDEQEKRIGQWVLYFETGALRAKGNFVNDRQNGEWRYFLESGELFQIGNFRNGVIEGEWKWFFPSGNIFREENYVKGRQHGLSVQYTDSATIVAQGEYVEGEREGFWIEDVGDSREEGNYIMGEKNGVWKTYYRNRQLHHTGNFIQGEPDGRHLLYYPDGTLKEEQYYVMGRRDKNWKKYHENGSLFLTITYRNDEEIRINGIRIESIRK